MLNRYFLVCHYNSLDISFPYFLKNIFFVVSLGITINILIYTTLILIKASLISIVLKKSCLFIALFTHSAFVLLLPYKLHLYTSYAHEYRLMNYCLMQLCFKSDRWGKVSETTTKNHNGMHSYRYRCSFLHVFTTLLSLHFLPVQSLGVSRRSYSSTQP